MADPQDLLALAAKVEAATGASFLLEQEVADAVGHNPRARLPAYTASLDAAMTLVPEGWDWSASSYGEDGASAEVWVHGWQDDTRINSFLATTPSLCLVVAALRARAAIREGESADA
jgi:hypothetical protein